MQIHMKVLVQDEYKNVWECKHLLKFVTKFMTDSSIGKTPESKRNS